MTQDKNTYNNNEMFRLAEFLEKLPEIQKYNDTNEKQAWTMADAFMDLDESFKKFSNNLLPLLIKRELDSEQALEVLHWID